MGNLAVAESLLTVNAINYLYFRGEKYLEAHLASYIPPYLCSGCGCSDYLWPNINDITLGTHDWTPAWDGVSYKIYINLCVPSSFNIQFNSITGYADVPNHDDWRLFSVAANYNGDSSPGDIYDNVNTPPPLGQVYNNVNAVVIWSSNPAFTVNVTLS